VQRETRRRDTVVGIDLIARLIEDARTALDRVTTIRRAHATATKKTIGNSGQVRDRGANLGSASTESSRNWPAASRRHRSALLAERAEPEDHGERRHEDRQRAVKSEALANTSLQEQALGVHQRLLRGDPTASLDASELILNPLVARLRAKWPTLDEIYCYDAATEVLVQYLQAPERYDPSKSSVLGWLAMQAHGDLTNDYQSRQKRFERSWTVESDLPSRPESEDPARLEDYLPPTQLDARLEPSRMLATVYLAFPDERDRQLIWHVIDGSRSTDEAAEILGLTNLTGEERTKEVRKNKDRIKTRLRRLNLELQDD
jgi:RNA polymerase sigma-70 factor (ECF subfamily)